MQWDPVQEDIVKKVSEKHTVPLEKGKEIVDVYLKVSMRQVRNYRPVTIVNMGLFCLDAKETNLKLVRLFKAYRKWKLTNEELSKALDMYIPIHKLAKIHRPRWGQRYLAAQYNNTLKPYEP